MPRRKLSYYKCISRSTTESNQMSQRVLSWRDPKEITFSDWTIIVNEGHTTSIYDVHRNVLGVGPNQSEYFKGLFKSFQFIEAQSHISKIDLQTSAAKSFPIMLDFMYSPKNYVRLKTEQACALRYLSDYFGIPTLFDKVTAFIEKDLTLGTLSTYWEGALENSDKHLIAVLLDFVAEELERVDKKFLMKLKPEHFIEVVTSAMLEVENEDYYHKIVTEYLALHYMKINCTQFYVLTCKPRISKICPKQAIYYIKMNEHFSSVHFEGERKLLLSRCAHALRGAGFFASLPTVKSSDNAIDDEIKQMISDYKSLSKDAQINLLEQALDMEMSKTSCSFKVTGAGIAVVNGIYIQDGFFQGAPKYNREIMWEGKKEKVSLCLIEMGLNNHCWFISILSQFSLELDEDVDFYCSTYTYDEITMDPPINEWEISEDGSGPVPFLTKLYD